MTETIELTTIRDFLRWTVTRFEKSGVFYGHGSDNAWDEAIALICYELKLNPELLTNFLDAKLTSKEKQQLNALIEKRADLKIPLAYLTHEINFAGLPFFVDERVLIPRSPIAELIEKQFEPWINANRISSILDLCTGSGCIAIACGYYFPNANIVASDISEDALKVAQKNIDDYAMNDQVQLFKSDLFSNLPAQKFDVIITNPPYVDKEEMSQLPAEYLHEPTLGLAGGDDGLDLAIQILKQAPLFLNEGGILIMEVGNSEFALNNRFPQFPFVWLEFEHGGGGVLMMTFDELHEIQRYLP